MPPEMVWALAVFCMAGLVSNSARKMPVEPWLVWLFQIGIAVTTISALGHILKMW